MKKETERGLKSIRFYENGPENCSVFVINDLFVGGPDYDQLT